MKQKKDSKHSLLVSSCVASAIFHGSLFYLLYLNPPLVRVVSTKLFPNASPHSVVLSDDKALEEFREKNEALDEAIAQTYFIRKNNAYKEEMEEGYGAVPQSAGTSENLLKELSQNLEDTPLVVEVSPLSATQWNESEEKIESLYDENTSEPEGLPTVVSILSQGRPFSYEIALSEKNLLTDDTKVGADVLSLQDEEEDKLKQALFPPSHELGIGTDFSFTTRALGLKAIQEPIRKLSDYELKEKENLDSSELFASSIIKQIENYGLPDVYVKKWDQQFNSHIATFEDEDGSIYFSIDLKTTPSFKQEALPSAYIFVIDLTTKYAKKEFLDHKKAILKSIKQLSKGDLFNIVLVGRKIQSFSNQPIAFNMKTSLDAEDFLEKKIDFTGRNKELLEGLNKTIETYCDDDKSLYNLFFLTGDTDKALSKEEKVTLQKVLKTARGKVAIFPVHVQDKETSSFYEALSITTGGKILSYPTATSYARKLSGLVLDVKTAILKELFVDVTLEDKNAQITLAPITDNFLRLYERKPLKIVGKIDRPTDFNLKIRGLNGEELVTIEKKISFSSSRKGAANLKLNYEKSLRDQKFNDFALGRCDIPDKLEAVSITKERRR